MEVGMFIFGNLMWPRMGPNVFERRLVTEVVKYLLLLGLLGEEHSLDVRQDTTLGDGHAGQELVQFLVVADGQLQVTGDDTGLLVVTGGVAGELEDLSGEVLHDGSEVHGGTGTNTLSIVSLAEQTVDTTDGELKSSPGAAGLRLALHFASLSASRHGDVVFVREYFREALRLIYRPGAR